MNSLGTPILHETSSDRASGYRILIYLGGLEAFTAISCSFVHRFRQVRSNCYLEAFLARIFELAYCSLSSSNTRSVYASVPSIARVQDLGNQSKLVSARLRAAEKH